MAVSCAAIALWAGCGDNLRPPSADAGAQDLNSLEVLDPPGDSVGLQFHGEATLEVRYRDPSGAPIPGASVEFALITSPTEATGGATIAATSVRTNDDGIASVVLVAGAEKVNFRVQATALAAPPAMFYVAVSNDGFAALDVTPEHAGFRASDDYGRVELRLFRQGQLRCADLTIDALPDSLLPPRALDGFGGTASYHTVAAGESYTVVGWAQATSDPGSARAAEGCVEIDASVVGPGRALSLLLPLHDRAPSVAWPTSLESTFDATPLADRVHGEDPVNDVWSILRCPLGRGQLLIDCAIDGQETDEALDCVVTASSALVAAIEATRGPRDALGCRPAETEAGAASLDATIEQALGNGPWPEGAGLEAVLAAREGPLSRFVLRSTVEATAGGTLVHRLDSLTVGEVDAFEESLIDSARPVIEQHLTGGVDPTTGRLALPSHGFTLDYGTFARNAFWELGLVTSGLDDRADDLGGALYDTLAAGSGPSCALLDELVCGAAGQSIGCIDAGCASGRTALDGQLDRWWQLLDGDELDFWFHLEHPVDDLDLDLVVDSIAGAVSAIVRSRESDDISLVGEVTEPAM